MSLFFNYFPKVLYSANAESQSLESATNITTRFNFENTLKENSSVFYEYLIKDGETPETIAAKYYDNPERHWIVLLFNNIIDPQFDWPLGYDEFVNYIRKKYSLVTDIQIVNPGTGYSNGFLTIQGTDDVGAGANAYFTVDANGNVANVQIISSGYGFNQAPNVTISIDNTGTGAELSANIAVDPIAWAKYNVHSYYKVITTTNSSGTNTEKIEVDYNTYQNNIIMQNGTNETIVLNDDSTVIVQISKEAKTYFDYELELNESKRKIKLLRVDFASQVEKEFRKKVKQ